MIVDIDKVEEIEQDIAYEGEVSEGREDEDEDEEDSHESWFDNITSSQTSSETSVNQSTQSRAQPLLSEHSITHNTLSSTMKLKEEIASATLVTPLDGLLLEVETDASDHAVSATLNQQYRNGDNICMVDTSNSQPTNR